MPKLNAILIRTDLYRYVAETQLANVLDSWYRVFSKKGQVQLISVSVMKVVSQLQCLVGITDRLRKGVVKHRGRKYSSLLIGLNGDLGMETRKGRGIEPLVDS